MKNINAFGDDRSLKTHGSNTHYWYSVKDIVFLLVHTRKNCL